MPRSPQAMAKPKGGYDEESREFLSGEIRHHVKDQGMPQDQAVAAAMSEARRSGKKVPPEGKTAGTMRKRAPTVRGGGSARGRTARKAGTRRTTGGRKATTGRTTGRTTGGRRRTRTGGRRAGRTRATGRTGKARAKP